MALMKWEPRRSGIGNPFSEMERFFDVFDPFFSQEVAGRAKGFWHPAIDIFENDEYVMVKADLPGLEEKDIHVTFDGHLLTIEGERKEDEAYNGDEYYSRERFWGRFHRILHLPKTVNTEGLKARYQHGVLKIEIPKKEEAKCKAIAVEMVG